MTSLKDGAKKLLTNAQYPTFYPSPDERYILYFDRHEHNYFSYDILGGVTKNVTENIPSLLSFNKVDNSDSRENPEVGFGAWINESAFLIYDNFDIWKVAIKKDDMLPKILHMDLVRKII